MAAEEMEPPGKKKAKDMEKMENPLDLYRILILKNPGLSKDEAFDKQKKEGYDLSPDTALDVYNDVKVIVDLMMQLDMIKE